MKRVKHPMKKTLLADLREIRDRINGRRSQIDQSRRHS